MTFDLKLLNVRFDNLAQPEVLQKIKGFLVDGRQHYIVLPYAEFLVEAREDEDFRNILNQADLCLAEGFGVILGSRILGQPLKSRVIGVELAEAIVREFGQNHQIFFFGAKEGVAREAAEKLFYFYHSHPASVIPAKAGIQCRIDSGKNPESGSRIKCGMTEKGPIDTLNGYVSDEEAIAKINQAQPEILLVGLGMPKQEKWFAANLAKMPSVKLAVGVGGAFDFISGRIHRAPKIFQKLGLEWLWRLLLQPWRAKHIYRSVFVFLWLVLKEKYKISD